MVVQVAKQPDHHEDQGSGDLNGLHPGRELGGEFVYHQIYAFSQFEPGQIFPGTVDEVILRFPPNLLSIGARFQSEIQQYCLFFQPVYVLVLLQREGWAEDFFEHANYVEAQVHEQVCRVPVLFLDY